MIAISLSPNTENDDVIVALKSLFQPWKWQKGETASRLEEWFKNYLKTTHVLAVNSGRSAMYLLLKAFGIGPGDEVIIQAFTCLAVPEVIKWVGAKPVFVDIDQTLNIDPKLLEQAINSKTKVIIVQHTFGIPANMDLITKIVQKHNLILIEDCAHSLGANYKGKKIGTFGDASFFSFGRDKIISSIFGGLAAVNSSDKLVLSNFGNAKSQLTNPNKFWIFQQLLHPLVFSIILPFYNIGLGKLILVFLQKLKLLSFPIYLDEKSGKKPKIFPRLLPNALAKLALNQLRKIDKFNNHRIKLAKLYFQKLSKIKNISLPNRVDGAVYLRFNILIKNATILRKKAKGSGMILGNWYHDVIDPEGTKDIAGYKVGMCKKAEEIASRSLNLPTNISIKSTDVDKIINLFSL